MNEGEYNQLMLERQQQVELALRNAIDGIATDDDWAIIRFECGLPALNAKGKKNVFDCESRTI